jgi:hypothetical protein
MFDKSKVYCNATEKHTWYDTGRSKAAVETILDAEQVPSFHVEMQCDGMQFRKSVPYIGRR